MQAVFHLSSLSSSVACHCWDRRPTGPPPFAAGGSVLSARAVLMMVSVHSHWHRQDEMMTFMLTQHIYDTHMGAAVDPWVVQVFLQPERWWIHSNSKLVVCDLCGCDFSATYWMYQGFIDFESSVTLLPLHFFSFPICCASSHSGNAHGNFSGFGCWI